MPSFLYRGPEFFCAEENNKAKPQTQQRQKAHPESGARWKQREWGGECWKAAGALVGLWAVGPGAPT